MTNIIILTENLISGMLPFVFLVLSGIYFTYKTGFFQLKKFWYSLRYALSFKNKTKSGISSYGALCNSLAATVGTGNIAGVAAAISVGGAGAVFWIWVSSFFSMIIKVMEITVSVVYRKRKGNAYIGGPMFYMNEKMGKTGKVMACVFSVACVFSAFTTGNITQINACSAAIGGGVLLKLFIGVIFAIGVFWVLKGGLLGITKFTALVTPLMAILYILLCLGVIFKNIKLLDETFLSIIKGAFNPKAVTGGVVGSVYITAITGAQKGIFSNEAGMGTSGICHAAASNANIKTQGYFGIFEVFVDTVIICTLTALTILSSGVIIDYKVVASSELVSNALSTFYGSFSQILLSLMLCLFGISSVIGWASYGVTASVFLKGEKAERIFISVYPLFCIVGALIDVGFAWRIADFFNGIMLIINTFAVLYLSKNAVLALKENANESKNKKNTRKTEVGRSGAYFG